MRLWLVVIITSTILAKLPLPCASWAVWFILVSHLMTNLYPYGVWLISCSTCVEQLRLPIFYLRTWAHWEQPPRKAVFKRPFILSPAVVATPFRLGILAHSPQAAQLTALLDYKHIQGQRGRGNPRLHLIDPMLYIFFVFEGVVFGFDFWGVLGSTSPLSSIFITYIVGVAKHLTETI